MADATYHSGMFRALILQFICLLFFSSNKQNLCNNDYNRTLITLICTILLVEIERARTCEIVLTENWLSFNSEFINERENFFER